MNLHIPDVRILEVHTAPWNSLRDNRHPSRNLPERKDLGLARLLPGIAGAAKLGYNFLHVGGTEPLGCPGLTSLCREAHRHGMLTSTMAGSVAPTAAQLDWLRFSIDLLGVEMAAGDAGRNRRRCAPRASDSTLRRLAVIRDAGIPFALVYSMASGGLADLRGAAEFAAAQRAAMLHVRPAPGLSGETMAEAWRTVESLYEIHRGKVVIHFDAVNRYSLPAEPKDLSQWQRGLARGTRRLGEIVSPLVIERDGTVSPLSYGFPRRFALGDLHDETLGEMAARWIESRAGAFCEVYRKVLGEARRADRTFGEWYGMLSAEAERREIGMWAAG